MAGLTAEEQEKLNELLKKQIEMQAEGYGLSTSYLESLKEILGIKSKLSTSEQNIADLSKKINREIMNQKAGSSDINELQKQIKNNQDLLNKAKVLETDLSKGLSEEDKKRIELSKESIDLINEKLKLLDQELAKEEKLRNKDYIKQLNEEIAAANEKLEIETNSMSLSAKQLLYLQKQTEELNKQNIERETALKQVNTLSNAIGAGLQNTKLSNIKNQIVGFIQNPLTIVTFLVAELVKTFLSLDKGIGDFAKDMNLTYRDAANLNIEFNKMANYSGEVGVTTKGIRETMATIGKSMGSNAILNEKDAVTMTKLRDVAGLANDELAEMEKLSLATGTSLEKNVENTLYAAKTTALNNGVLLNEKQIMQEVAKASAATKLSLANNPEALAKAAAQAKSLGMNLEQVSSIADKMLDIESSISNELEAELLTGKNLNLEQARLYALNNDMEGLSREIAKNFGSAAEFSKMNRLQQEAAAKAVGMSREELAKTLTDQEALKGYSGKQAEDAKAALEAARARGMSEAEIKKQGINGLMQQQSMQDRFNQSIEKLKEIFVSLVTPLMPVLDIFMMILKPINWIATAIGSVMSFLGQISGGILPKIISGFIAFKLLTGGIGTNIAGIGKGLLGIGKNLISGGGIKSAVGGMFGSKAAGAATTASGAAGKASGSSGKGIKGALSGISGGIKTFSKVDVADIGKLALSALALVALTPAIPALLLLQAVNGKLIQGALTGIGKGIAAMGKAMSKAAPEIIVGELLLAGLGLALWTFVPIVEAFGKAIKSVFEGLASVIKEAAEGFSKMFTALGNVDIAHLLLIGPALVGIGLGLAALGIGGAIGAIGGGLSKLLGGGGPLEMLDKLAVLGEPLNLAASSLQNMASALTQVSAALASIDVSKLESLDKFASNRSSESVVGGIIDSIVTPIKAIGGKTGGAEGGGSSSNEELIGKINDLIAVIKTSNTKPVQVAVTMDGKKVAEGLGNHATQLGTSANVGTSKIQ